MVASVGRSSIGVDAARQRQVSCPFIQRPWWQHAFVAVILSVVAWSAAEQRWRIAVVCLLLLSCVALFMGRGSRGDHIAPSPWHMAALAGALSLPIVLDIAVGQLPWLSETSSAVACLIAFGAMRVDERRCKMRLATGDFRDGELW